MYNAMNFFTSLTENGFQSGYKYPGCPAFNNNALVFVYVVHSAILVIDLGSEAFFFSGSSASNHLSGGENSVRFFYSTQSMFALPFSLTVCCHLMFPFLSFAFFPFARTSTVRDIATNGGQSKVAS